MTRTSTWRIVSGVAAFCAAAAPALAQKPGILPGDEGGGMLRWGVTVGLAGLILAAALINPKRSHLS